MPAPTNLSAATAADVGALPADVTQNVHDAGTTYTVWHSVVAPAGVVMLGAWSFGDLTTYTPTIEIYEGPASSPVSLLSIAAQNKPVQFPVTGGETYYLRSVTNAGNPTPASLRVRVEVGPSDAAQRGDLMVPDDTEGFPAAIINPATATVRRYVVPFPSGEWGDILTNGTILAEDNIASVVKLYSAQFVLQATVDPFGATSVNEHVIRVSPALQTFYVGARITSNPTKITTVDRVGNVGATTWTLTDTGLTALAPNSTGAIIYVSGQVSSVNTPIKRWLTASSTFGSDLIAGQGANTRVFDLLVLADDTIIAGWLNTSSGAVDVRHLNDSGTVLATYSTTSITTTDPKLAYDSSSYQTTFWLWTHASNQSTWTQITSSTMTAASTVGPVREYSGGAYQGAATETPDARFGNAFSCPFFLLRSEITVSPPQVSVPCCATCACDQPGPGGTQATGSLPSATGPTLPPVEMTTWTPLCVGGGDVPTASDATDAESWIS